MGLIVYYTCLIIVSRDLFPTLFQVESLPEGRMILYSVARGRVALPLRGSTKLSERLTCRWLDDVELQADCKSLTFK
jgi:hypothetical protein